MHSKKNTPPIAKDVYYDEVQFSINSPQIEISFGRIPSELATDKETNLRSNNFKITKVYIDGEKYSGKAAGVTIDGKRDLNVNLNLKKPLYQPYKFTIRPIDVLVDFEVKDGRGLKDKGSVTFQVIGAESHEGKVINGTRKPDRIIGGDKNNSISGGRGDDLINGMSGNDTLAGGYGSDVIEGEEGNDHLIGGNGNDELHSGSGRDLLSGGAGRDIFVCGRGVNTIEDFNHRKDSVLIEISSIESIRRIKDKDGNLSLKYPGGKLIVLDTERDKFFDSLLTLESQDSSI